MAKRKPTGKSRAVKMAAAGDDRADTPAVDALQESEARYRAVVRQSADCVTLIEAGTLRLLEANPAFFELLGYSEEDLSELTVYDIVAADRKEIDRNAQSIIEDQERSLGERIQAQGRLHGRGGSQCPSDLHRRPPCHVRGRPRHHRTKTG